MSEGRWTPSDLCSANTAILANSRIPLVPGVRPCCLCARPPSAAEPVAACLIGAVPRPLRRGGRCRPPGGHDRCPPFADPSCRPRAGCLAPPATVRRMPAPRRQRRGGAEAAPPATPGFRAAPSLRATSMGLPFAFDAEARRGGFNPRRPRADAAGTGRATTARATARWPMPRRRPWSKLRQAPYADDFRCVFGAAALGRRGRRFLPACFSIEQNDRRAQFRPRRQRYDLFLRGELRLSAQELRGHWPGSCGRTRTTAPRAIRPRAVPTAARRCSPTSATTTSACRVMRPHSGYHLPIRPGLLTSACAGRIAAIWPCGASCAAPSRVPTLQCRRALGVLPQRPLHHAARRVALLRAPRHEPRGVLPARRRRHAAQVRRPAPGPDRQRQHHRGRPTTGAPPGTGAFGRRDRRRSPSLPRSPTATTPSPGAPIPRAASATTNPAETFHATPSAEPCARHRPRPERHRPRRRG